MRLTVCLEGNSEGRVLASVDMEEIVKMTITDDIEKSNFNQQMFKSCTDTSYQCGYQQGKQDAISFIEEKLLDLELFADNDYWSNNKSMMWKTEEVRDILEHLRGAEE